MQAAKLQKYLLMDAKMLLKLAEMEIIDKKTSCFLSIRFAWLWRNGYFCGHLEFNNQKLDDVMKTIRLMLMAAIVTTVFACGRDGEYVQQGDTICYKYWTFSFGTIYDTLPEVNPATFESVNKWLGHDDQRAYFKDKLVVGVDIATLKAERYPLFRDKKDYYYKTAAMNV